MLLKIFNFLLHLVAVLIIAVLILLALASVSGCKFSHQAQKSSTRSDSMSAHQSSSASVSSTDSSNSNEWSWEEETQYGTGKAQDSGGNVYNYYYPTKTIYRGSGRQQQNAIKKDSTGQQQKDTTNHSTASTATASNTNGSLLSTWQLIGLCALACIIVFAAGKIHSNYFFYKRSATLAVPNVKGNAGMQPPG